MTSETPALPELRTVPLYLSEAMGKALQEAMEDNPYWYRRMKGVGFQVGKNENADWRDTVPNEQLIIATYPTEEYAQNLYNALRRQWIWSEVLKSIPA